LPIVAGRCVCPARWLAAARCGWRRLARSAVAAPRCAGPVADGPCAAAARGGRLPEPAGRRTVRASPQAAARNARLERALLAARVQALRAALRRARLLELQAQPSSAVAVALQRRQAARPAWTGSVRSSRDRHQCGTLSSSSHVTPKANARPWVRVPRPLLSRRGSFARSMLNLRSRCSSSIHSWMTLCRTGSVPYPGAAKLKSVAREA
jgi:hypothetical protein